MTAWCVGPGRRHLGDVGRLCVKHLDQLGGWLRDVEDEDGLFEVAPSLSAALGDHGSGTPAFERVPVRLDAVVLTDPRHGTGWAESEEERRLGQLTPPIVVLTRWAQKVRDGRQLTGVWPPNVPEARRMLTRHLDWCAGQPWIDRMFRQVRDLRNALVRLNGGVEDKPLPGVCPATDGEAGEDCGGPLWPSAPRHTSGAPFTSSPLGQVSAVECGDNPAHRWEGVDLARLALIVESQHTSKEGTP